MERFLFFVITLIPVHNCIMVITSERDERPQLDGHFVIPGLNLSSLGTFTMCARFNIYQFIVHSEVDSGKYQYKNMSDLVQGIFPGFGTGSLVHCDNSDYFCPYIAAADRKLKHVYVQTHFFGQRKVLPTSLKPNTWNYFCLKVNRTSANIKLNDEASIKYKADKGHTAYPDDSYRFMDSMYGALTDLNIWDVNLSDAESERWMNCTIKTEGNVFSWQSSSQHVQMTGLKRVTDSLDNICYLDRSSHLIVGNEPLNFDETFDYCNKIQSMIVISSKETAMEVNKTLESFPPDSWGVYSGHTDIELDGEWVVHGTQQEMAWKNWWPGEPNEEDTDEDCAILDRFNMKFTDSTCLKPLVPVCNLAEVCPQ